MLRKMQEDVNRKVESFFKGRPDLEARPLSEFEKALLERLSHQQGHIRDIWRRFMDAIGVPPDQEGE